MITLEKAGSKNRRSLFSHILVGGTLRLKNIFGGKEMFFQRDAMHTEITPSPGSKPPTLEFSNVMQQNIYIKKILLSRGQLY